MYRLVVFVTVLMLAIPTASQCQQRSRASTRAVPDSALVRELAELLRGTARLPGLSIAAMRDDRVAFAAGFGTRALGGDTRVDTATQFGAASLSKVVTATAALLLHQRGALDLDRPVRRSIPSFPDPTDGITPRRLAAHVSGLPHYGPGSMASTARFEDALGSLDVFARAPRVGVPGERQEYSTHGITLLSAIMEVADGRPILALMDEEVFDRLDMPNTGPMRMEHPTSRMASPHEHVKGVPVLLPARREVSYSWGGAGLRTTPADLVRMSRAYFNGFLHDSTVRLAFSEQRTTDGEASGVGFIWRVGVDWRGRPIAHHAGVNDGARGALILFLHDSTAIAVQVNVRWTSSIESTAMVFAEALFASDRRGRDLAVSGRYRGTFDGEPATGTWSIAGDTGSISVPEGFGRLLERNGSRVDRLPVRAIREGVYALVTPWGLYRLALSRGGTVTGETVVASRTWQLAAEP